MASANVECASVTPTTLAVLATVLWIQPRVWLPMGKSAMEEELVNAEPVIAQIPNFKVPHVRCVRPVLVSVQSISKCLYNKNINILEMWYVGLDRSNN